MVNSSGAATGRSKAAKRRRIGEVIHRYRVLEIVAVIAGLVAVGQELYLGKQFERQKTDLQEIVANVSTGYLPDWPEHGDKLEGLVSSSKSGDELAIRIDSIGYLSFTKPDRFNSYFTTLLKQAAPQDIRIQILTLDENATKDALDEQFGPHQSDDFTSIKDELIQQYLSAHKDLLGHTSFYGAGRPSYENFRDAVMFVDDDHCSKLKALGVEIYSTSDRSIMNGPFMWLKYSRQTMKEMIFAYPKFRAAKTGYGFRTNDSHLMEIFLKDFENVRDSKLTTTRLAKDDHLYPSTYSKLKPQSLH